MAQTCELCERSTDAALEPSCGLKICPDCLAGDHGSAVEALGATLDYEILEEDTVGQARQLYIATIDLSFPPLGLGIDAVFKEEELFGFPRKVLDKLRLGDPKVGDPLFDEKIWIDERDDGQMVRCLEASSGLKELILELVSSSGAIAFHDESIKIVLTSYPARPDEVLGARAALSALRHLTAIASA